MNITMDATSGGADDDTKGRCELLGSFALFVQGALGALALLSLVWKRSRENPQRPLLIWFFDASKQVWGSVLVHIANLLLSMLSSGQFSTEPTPKSVARRHGDVNDEVYHANPCSFYLLNLAIDTTIGIFILIIILRIITRLLLLSPFTFWHTGIASGDYGDPPKWSWWGKQAIIYFCGLMGMKFVVWIMFQIFPWLGRFGDWLLGWTEGDKRVQVFFVMFFFPLVMNAVQYWIIDSYIQAKKPTDSSGALSSAARLSSSSCRRNNRHSFDDSEDIFSDDDNITDESGVEAQNLLQNKSNGHCSNRKDSLSSTNSEYDPDLDGDSTAAKAVDSERSSTYDAVRSGAKPAGRRDRQGNGGSTAESLSSMMLLPGSRGPSTPGYADDAESRRLTLGSGRSVGGRSGKSLRDDDSTLVGREEDYERGGRE